ncbi:dynamin family protein [Herbiconiux sp. SYSU D00978]|uniref:dynamin family protein n=1 Tax=Herbiconiux sp. SYSU D00978 TaxID=2812562 RepID=UPI001A97920E|nr:dynamin family protein [Herbiconiux sp. SYSU D00978]
MTTDLRALTADLVAAALGAYIDDPEASAALRGYARRLDEPLRVALAGMVKAGKSTLLNAVIGDEIAPTDAGECTRVVTWYRYHHTPRITLHPVAGTPRSLPVRRVDGRLVLDLGPTPAEDVQRLVVEWPAAPLKDLILIDTPGIGSLSDDVSERSNRFLLPEDAPSEADAIVYLLRHLHATDLTFLQAFRDAGAGRSATVNSLAVLSRADEIGAGRLNALLSARDIADRYRNNGDLRALALGVVPIAGLLAQTARTLRQSEYAALAELARLGRDERERLLVSADRFVRSPAVPVEPATRAALLDRFGMFGIRMATVLIRGGATDATELAHQLVRQSGLDDLLRTITTQFGARAEHLKVRTALLGVETLLRERPRPGTEVLAARLERLQAEAHEFRELQLLALSRTAGLGLSRVMTAEIERLVGGDGMDPAVRLGLAEDATAEDVRTAALAAVRKWRGIAESPLTERSLAEVCHTVVRSCEGLAAAARAAAPGTTPAEDPASGGGRVVALAEPAPAAGHERGEQRRTG